MTLASEDNLTDEMFDAIRGVINFARFDETYTRMSKSQLRPEYFAKNLEKIATECKVDPDELRAWLRKFVKGDDETMAAIEYLSQRPNAPRV